MSRPDAPGVPGSRYPVPPHPAGSRQQHPLYRTSNQAYGSRAPTVHEVPVHVLHKSFHTKAEQTSLLPQSSQARRFWWPHLGDGIQQPLADLSRLRPPSRDNELLETTLHVTSHAFSNTLAQCGMYRDNGLNTYLEKSHVTGPDNFITPYDTLNFHPSYNASGPSHC
ncbi:piercer of microtubule wall 1 protein isoform 2-T2 [Mergus octosetaceus]